MTHRVLEACEACVVPFADLALMVDYREKFRTKAKRHAETRVQKRLESRKACLS